LIDTSALPESIRIALHVTTLLHDLGVPYLIGGSMASIVHGEMRLTNDLDLVADISEAQIPALVAALQNEFYVDELSLRRAVRERKSFNLIYLPTVFKIDVFIHHGDEWAVEQMRQSEAKALLFGDEATVRNVASAGTMVLQKLLWFRKGGGVSERQWRDVQGILKVQGERLNVSYLRQWADDLRVSDLLERALSEAGIEQ
jgi:hypothetical protein